MHWEILDARRISILRALVEMPETDCFYLAGGTALSLQLGLRESFDFAFMTERRFNSEALLARLKERWENVRAIHVDQDTCDVLIENVQTSFMRYPYPMISDYAVDQAAMPGLKLCGAADIAVMKLSAIGGRGARKDFYDLYQIYQKVPRFDSAMLSRCAHLKFGERFDMTYMIAGMSFFDDAETEALPKTFVSADWEEIKRFLRAEQAKMLELEAQRY